MPSYKPTSRNPHARCGIDYESNLRPRSTLCGFDSTYCNTDGRMNCKGCWKEWRYRKGLDVRPIPVVKEEKPNHTISNDEMEKAIAAIMASGIPESQKAIGIKILKETYNERECVG